MGRASRAGEPRSWSSLPEAARVCFQPVLLRRTLTTALVVGLVLSLVNQGHVVVEGHAGAATWVRIAFNFVVPFLVSNAGALAATRSRR